MIPVDGYEPTCSYAMLFILPCPLTSLFALSKKFFQCLDLVIPLLGNHILKRQSSVLEKAFFRFANCPLLITGSQSHASAHAITVWTGEFLLKANKNLIII